MEITNGEIIKNPKLINSSDENYFKNVISKISDNQIILNKKIIDENEYFQIKFYVLHDRNINPTLVPNGKISGQKKINIIDQGKIDDKNREEEKSVQQLIGILSSTLIFILSLLTLSLYKNNNIRLKTNKILHEKNKTLLREINELKKSKG